MNISDIRNKPLRERLEMIRACTTLASAGEDTCPESTKFFKETLDEMTLALDSLNEHKMISAKLQEALDMLAIERAANKRLKKALADFCDLFPCSLETIHGTAGPTVEAAVRTGRLALGREV